MGQVLIDSTIDILVTLVIVSVLLQARKSWPLTHLQILQVCVCVFCVCVHIHRYS